MIQFGDRVIRAWRLERITRGVSDEGEPWQQTGSYFALDSDGEEISVTLHDKYNVSVDFFLMNATSNPAAWAVVFFTDEFDAEEIFAARGEFSDAVKFAPYRPCDPPPWPPLGCMVIFDPDALPKIAARHPLFHRVFEVMGAKPRDQNWVALIDTSALVGTH